MSRGAYRAHACGTACVDESDAVAREVVDIPPRLVSFGAAAQELAWVPSPPYQRSADRGDFKKGAIT
jgi:hypothetical protein